MTGGKITDGAYDVPADKGARPGTEYTVQITALRKTGKLVPNIFDANGPKMELDEQYIPARYNEETTLRVTTRSGENQFDFALEGKTANTPP